MSNICPYPGLRPFNEHEAIFFKGRDEHIKKIIAQLAKNKFIMVTGASGDGKSSLIYAGVIPNAKAGFFKAKHNNWIIADFRPERSPVKNMAHAIAAQLGYKDAGEVEKQLGYGFSSLVNLYKASPYSLDTESDSFKQLELPEQKQVKRKAANLLILVDQFEEFFTNAENFSNDEPSAEAQAAVNLLIETSKIAIENDIPIYVVCTMRSDYIGQCSAFRGLPELIGFSQFFVPRLKRKELQQVIMEPAILSGNKISNRLTQTLINELGDGLDQLPVLQHALNQIWKAAGNGEQEMDLLHLVKVAGLVAEALPEKDKAIFDEWFKTVPDFKKNFFKKSSLENVLNAHANELYETAHELYNRNHETPVSRETAQFIIKKAFQSLTKTDGGRTVRSRMTLQEITNVIHRKEITADVVGGVLDIFRMPGNTFLRPFISSDGQYVPLSNTDILDITHESLIRNWRLLSDWTNEEYQDILTFRDFEKQMQRWVESKKSNDYLLPIGPLTYFESWFLKLNPNQHWLRKYDETNLPENEKLRTAEAIINHGKEFIRRSARKLFLTRTVMKYGALRITACFAILVIIGLSAYFFLDYRSKLNETVWPKIEGRCFAYLNNKTVNNKEKANFLINEEILNPGSLQKNLQKLSSDSLAIDISLAVAGKVLIASNEQQTELPGFAQPAIGALCKMMDQYVSTDTGIISESKTERITQFMDMLNFLSIRHPKAYSLAGAKSIADRSAELLYDKYIRVVLSDSVKNDFDGIILLNALRLYMLQNRSDTTGFRRLIQSISPFQGSVGRKRFAKLFPKTTSIKLGTWGRTEITYKGGYLVLASLFSGLGDYESVSRCMDSLYVQNPKYTEADYGNFSEIINFSLNFNAFSEDVLNKLVSNYARISIVEKSIVARKLLNEIPTYEQSNDNGLTPASGVLNFGKGNAYFIMKYLLPRSNFDELWNLYYKLLIGSSISENRGGLSFTKDEKLFEVAYYYKERGQIAGGVYLDSTEAMDNFHKFSEAFGRISVEYLKQERVFKMRNSTVRKKNSYLLLFPEDIIFFIAANAYDYDINWINVNNRMVLFEGFLEHEGLEKKFKTDNTELLFELIYECAYVQEDISFDECESIKPVDFRVKFFNEFVDSIRAFGLITKNTVIQDEGILELCCINRLFKARENNEAMTMLNKWGFEKMLEYFKANQTTYKGENLKPQIKIFSRYLAMAGHRKEALQVISTLNETYERRNALIGNTLALLYDKKNEDRYIYLDSVLNLVKDDDKFGLLIMKAFGQANTSKYTETAYNLMGRLGEKKKINALANYVLGLGEAQEYYKATSAIPQFLSSDREFKMLDGIVGSHIRQLMLENRISNKYLSSVTVVTAPLSGVTSDWESITADNIDEIFE